MGLNEAIPKAFPGSSWNPLNWAPSLPSPSKISLPGVSSLPGLSSLPGASLFGTKDQAWFKSMLTKFGLSGVLATVFSFFLYAAYLKFGKKDDKGVLDLLKDKVSEYVNKIPGIGMLRKVPLLEKLIPSPESLIHVPKGTQSALSSISGIAPGIASKLNPAKWEIFNKKKIAEQEDDENYQAGEPYGDPTAMATGIATDLKSMGLKGGFKDLRTLLEVAKTKGKPINDRDMTMEKMIAIAASLPRTSKARGKLTGIIIDTLWKSLQHPPLSYMGHKFQYRTPDGSYNNPLHPDLGKAGSPYARTVPKMKHLHGVPPDPGLLFDLLMARSDETFKENPAGISSVLFYHASIIIHDCFRTNRVDPSISDTSSYLDLAPLYGSNLKDQLSIRTMQRGLLKPDSFVEKRLLGQPPGVNVMLVMYNRFHNYVADVLLKINENGRFTLRPTQTEEDKRAALAQQDEDIFQTARLVTNGLYVNISLHDYLRGLTNTHHSASDWTLDPRIEVGRMFDPEGVPRGIGNQVSAEFNLLYRFHSVISQRDEKWTNQFMQKIFPHKPLDQLTPQDFVQGLLRFEQSIPEDPAERTFDGLKRGANGRFDDAELVNIMKESMEDPAGLFNARMVPKALRMIEISGIMTARKWNLASLNEMRSFFGLKRHDTFEDINPDPQIADLMRKLYGHPDMVEMYPGLFLEDGKPRMDPGCGGCPPYTVGRAVFSDAVCLVRSDRFLTVDYTPSYLTAWGYQEVKQDYDILGGSMFWKLFQRAFPGWFPYNSLHCTQPMFTRKMNEQIAREIGTIDQYTFQDPSPPPTPNVATKYSAVTKILSDQKNFRVIWAKNLNEMTPGKKYDSYMLGGDTAANTAQRNLVKEIMFSPPEFMQLLSQTLMHVGKELLDDESLILGKDLNQLDIIRDIAIPLNTRIMADLFCLDLKTDENKGGSLNSTELYTHLMSVRTFGFNNFDPALALRRRKEAHEGSKILTATTLKVISGGSNPVSSAEGIVSKATGTIAGAVTGITSKVPFVSGPFSRASKKAEAKANTGSLRWYGQNVVKELISAGKSPEEAADICWLTAVAGVGAPIGMFADVLNYFLQEENWQHWEAIQNLSSSSDPESADKELRKYVLEAQRLTSNQRDIRLCVSETTVDGKTYKPGDVVIALFGPACRDTDAIPEPDQFKLDRPEGAYIHLGYGPHACLGREIAITFISSLVKLCGSLKHLRPAPGKMGALKQIQINGDRAYLNDSWSYLTTDPTTWKVHFDGIGKGVFRAPKLAAAVASDINYDALKKQQDEFIKNNPSTLMPNGPDASQYANGTADLTKPATYSETVGATAPVPNGGPLTNAVGQQSSMPGYQGLPDGQPQQQPSTKENPGLLNRAMCDFCEINQKTVGTAHDLAHGFVNNLPGGSSASQLTHGIARSFIPISDGASGSASEQI